MTQFILHLLAASFWIFGVRTLFSHDHLLYPIYEWAERNVSEYLIKPTIGCVMCMASLHGLVWFMIFIKEPVWMVIIFMICLCGLNTILDKATS